MNLICTIFLELHGGQNDIQNFTEEDWAKFGRYLSNNRHFTDVTVHTGALNDQTISHLFRGLTGSSSIEKLRLFDNVFSVAGVRSMVPFLQNAKNLNYLDLDNNNLQSEGFSMLWRALCDSPIKTLLCGDCGIESIEIDKKIIPRHLRGLHLYENNINADGCRELAKLLQGGDSALAVLNLDDNKIDDEGVGILVDALQSNTTLKRLHLNKNDCISKQGEIMLLKLVNDISSIKATLRSNRSLRVITLQPVDASIERNIDMATSINNLSNADAAGRMKVILTQLESARREELAHLQGINHSLYSEIDPLHLPEVLALIDRHIGEDELYLALVSSIMTLLSTVNMIKCIQQERAYYMSKVEELDAKLASMKRVAAGDEGDHRSSKVESVESRGNKRCRK